MLTALLIFWCIELRNERNADDDSDFALGKGGNIIALAQLLYNTDDVGAALQHIAADMNNPKSTKAKPPIPTQVETDKMDKVHIQELSYPVLMSYLRSRHVDADIGKRYCKEIWYTFKTVE